MGKAAAVDAGPAPAAAAAAVALDMLARDGGVGEHILLVLHPDALGRDIAGRLSGDLRGLHLLFQGSNLLILNNNILIYQ